MKALNLIGQGIAAIGAWESAKGVQRTGGKDGALTVVRDAKPIGKNGKELGVPATISEKNEVPALAGREEGWMPASREGRARINWEMAATLENLSKNAGKINAGAPMHDIRSAALSGSGHSC